MLLGTVLGLEAGASPLGPWLDRLPSQALVNRGENWNSSTKGRFSSFFTFEKSTSRFWVWDRRPAQQALVNRGEKLKFQHERAISVIFYF
mgnify:CR=1 FL=1